MSLQPVIPGRLLCSRARFRFTSRSYTANYRRRMKARLGTPKALTAAARKLARIRCAATGGPQLALLFYMLQGSL